MGIETEKRRNPPWERDELILALDLYFEIPFSKVSDTHPDVVALSELLNKLPLHFDRDAKFRNPNGVAMKLANLARLDPKHAERGVKGLKGGGHLEREVWHQFAGNRTLLAAVASHIRSAYVQPEAAAPVVVDEDEEEFAEGRVLYRLHRSRERNRKLVEAAKSRALKRDGLLQCSVCMFNFATLYGELGDGYIEAHHVVPVSSLGDGSTTKVADLALVCANCHRMLHRRRPWLLPAELKRILG